MGLKRIHRHVADILQTVTFAAVAQHSLLRPEATTFLKAYRCHEEVICGWGLPQFVVVSVVDGGRHSWLWLNATSFEKSWRGYLQLEATTVCCS